jgi:hypothetical protein
MTFRDDALAALAAGIAAQPRDPNPYAGQSLALAKLWRIGYNRMLTDRLYQTRAFQKYLAGREQNTD